MPVKDDSAPKITGPVVAAILLANPLRPKELNFKGLRKAINYVIKYTMSKQNEDLLCGIGVVILALLIIAFYVYPNLPPSPAGVGIGHSRPGSTLAR